MSLTSELSTQGSIIREFMDEAFPTPKLLAADWRQRRPPDSTSARMHLESATAVPWSTLGQAIDHRLRYAFSDSTEPETTVAQGLQFATQQRLITSETAGSLRAELARVVNEYRPSDRGQALPLPTAAEERLLRICYVMSWFEAFFRSGRPDAALVTEHPPSRGLDHLLAAVPEYSVTDLMWQIELAAGALERARATTLPDGVHSGPTFAGSGDIGGADADLIVGDILIDVKATVEPSRIKRVDLRQLLGYVLIDTTKLTSSTVWPST